MNLHFSRLVLLVFSLVFVMFMMRLHLLVTVFVRQCWQAEEVWLDATTAVTPFSAYLVILCTLGCWSLLEGNIAWRHVRTKTNAVIAGVCCVASLMLLVGWLYFWLFMQYQSGHLNQSSFLTRWLAFEAVDTQAFSPGYPSFYDLLYQYSCSQGRDFYEMSAGEIDALYIEYEAVVEQALQFQQ